MPRIKRWFPVSHDINSDPEVIELVDKFNLPGLKIWLQLLSIADRNDGEVRGNIDWICKSFLYLFTSNSRRYGTKWRQDRCKMTLEWMQDKHWISIKQGSISVINHWKYHRTTEHDKFPPDQTEPDRSEDHKNEASPDPQKSEKKTLDSNVKLWADKVYQSDPLKFKKLIIWIHECEKYNFTPAMIAAALEHFYPYRAEVDHWYPYLDKLVEKAKADLNRDQSIKEHELHKEEVRQTAKIIRRIKNA